MSFQQLRAMICVSAASLFFVVCGCQAPARPLDGVVTVEVPAVHGNEGSLPTASTRPVQMAPGDRLIVRLGAQAGTGYIWQMAGPAPAVLSAEDPGQPDAKRTESDVVGGGTWTSFKFRAVSQGTAQAQFVLRRPWEETGKGEARVVNVPITVEP